MYVYKNIGYIYCNSFRVSSMRSTKFASILIPLKTGSVLDICVQRFLACIYIMNSYKYLQIRICTSLGSRSTRLENVASIVIPLKTWPFKYMSIYIYRLIAYLYGMHVCTFNLNISNSYNVHLFGQQIDTLGECRCNRHPFEDLAF